MSYFQTSICTLSSERVAAERQMDRPHILWRCHHSRVGHLWVHRYAHQSYFTVVLQTKVCVCVFFFFLFP